MKLFKSITISSDGSFYFQYNLSKRKNNAIFKKKDDKNFKLNQKRISNKSTFKQSINSKKKYL
jgi:hypothetical protein